MLKILFFSLLKKFYPLQIELLFYSKRVTPYCLATSRTFGARAFK